MNGDDAWSKILSLVPAERLQNANTPSCSSIFEEEQRLIKQFNQEYAAHTALLEARLALYTIFAKLDAEIKSLAREDVTCRRFMTAPGVGPITALTFKAVVDDPARFKSSRTVAAHFGLTPRRYQSGETDHPAHISRAGDREVRSALYIAAHSMVTRTQAWCSLKAWGVRLTKTRDTGAPLSRWRANSP